MRKPHLPGFLPESDTNRALQPQKMVRGLKFQNEEVKGLYYLCSEKKGADQLRSYRAADLRLCLHIWKKKVFSGGSSYMRRVMRKPFFFAYAKTKTQISFTVTAKLISAFVFATRIV